MTSFEIYLITRLDPLGHFLSFMGVIGLIVFIIVFIIMLVQAEESTYDEDIAKYKKYASCCFKGFLVGVSALFLASMIPTTKEAAFIIAAPLVLNNEDAKEIPANILKLANEKLKELTEKE